MISMSESREGVSTRSFMLSSGAAKTGDKRVKSWIVFASNNRLVITIISLSYVLKLWIELITLRNDNVTKKFYWVEVF